MFKFNQVVIAVLSAVTLWGCAASPTQQAEEQARTKQLNTPVDQRVTVPFDEAQAKKGIELGPTTIRGVLYHKVNTAGKNAGDDNALTLNPAVNMPNVKMFLYPVTAHLKEFVRLEHENRPSAFGGTKQLKKIIPDERIYKYCIASKTDEFGRYVFKDIKPGHYYLVAAPQNITTTGTETVQDGTSVISDGYDSAEVAHYHNQNFRVKTPLDFEEFIEVKAGDKEIKLESRMRMN